MADWSIEPFGCDSLYRQKNPEHFFCTRGPIGQLAPMQDGAEWVYHTFVPENSSIRLLGNGFCACYLRRRRAAGVEIFCPEPGVLWGQRCHIPDGVLIDSKSGEKSEFQGDEIWYETERSHVLVVRHDQDFCLVSKFADRGKARHIANGYLSRSLEKYARSELERRAGAVQLLEEMPHHDSLAVICVESILKALRPAEGRIPHRWIQSSQSDTPQFNVNELFPLLQAWSLINVEIAEELLLCALKIQSNAGALPVLFSPVSGAALLEAPKPLIVKAAEKVWSIRQRPELLKTMLPLLRRNIQWMLNHFDPKRRKVYCWQNRNEPIDPELFQSDLVSVDLATLLLTEIEALSRLEGQLGETRKAWFVDEGNELKSMILDQFWNREEGLFSQAYQRESLVSLKGFPALLPLLWQDLPQTRKDATLDYVQRADHLTGLHGVLSWQKSSLNDQSFPLLRQFLVLEAFKASDPNHSLLRDFSRLTLQGFVEWHALALETEKRLQINPSIAALVINVQSMHQYRYHGQGAITGFFFRVLRKVRADRNDFVIIAATIFTLLCVRAFYADREAPPTLSSLEMQVHAAFANHDVEALFRSCRQIIDHYPDKAGQARLLMANQLVLGRKYDVAEELLLKVREDYPDCPGAMISLGIAQHLQGKLDAAEANYDEFCYLFERIFPGMVAQIDEYRFLIQEGIRTAPPKWREVYRTDFMHELE